MQALMEMEVDKHIGASRHERTEGRSGHRNGYRERTWNTRAGAIELMVPRVRDGSYFPSLLVAVGDNPQRLKSEASFAHLCGVAPVPASSGKTVRHRLNRGGNRDANRALHVLALGRMSWDERTREYVTRRAAEGKSKREILRCLKRYVAREVYRILTAPGALPSSVSMP